MKSLKDLTLTNQVNKKIIYRRTYLKFIYDFVFIANKNLI